jgi:hypothetical protein
VGSSWDKVLKHLENVMVYLGFQFGEEIVVSLGRTKAREQGVELVS